MKKTMKKSTKGFLNNLITYAIVIIAFVFTQMALSKMIPGVTISRSLKGQLIPICVYIVMAVSLNLTVGISGELALGHAGFMSVGAFSGIIMSGWLLNAFQMENETMRLVLAMLAGGVCAAIAGVLIGIPVLRLRGDYLAIITLGFGVANYYRMNGQEEKGVEMLKKVVYTAEHSKWYAAFGCLAARVDLKNIGQA